MTEEAEAQTETKTETVTESEPEIITEWLAKVRFCTNTRSIK